MRSALLSGGEAICCRRNLCRPVNLLFVGLDGSGKTTALNRLVAGRRCGVEAERAGRGQSCDDVLPTVGFTVRRFKFDGVNVTAFDMSGQGRYRNLWSYYLSHCSAVVFVIDSADQRRLVVAAEELDLLLGDARFRSRSAPLLVLANKADRPAAVNDVRLADFLRLRVDVRTRPWLIVPTNALNGDGLERAVDWLLGQFDQMRVRLDHDGRQRWYF